MTTRSAVRTGAVLLFAWVCAAQAAGVSPRVVIVSIDGLRPDLIETGALPTLATLQDRGVAAERAINDLPSATMTNHATMVTGLSADRHGLLADFALPGSIPQPTLFDFAGAQGARCAFLVSKEKLLFLARPAAIEAIVFDPAPDALVLRALELLTPAGVDLLFIHLREPDSTGHRAGWLSAEYQAAAARMDTLIAQLVEHLDAQSERPTYLLITADHGGDGPNHFVNIPANRLIPWIVIGPDIPAGAMIAGTVTTADTTPTALWLMGLPVPEGLSGVARTGLRGVGEGSSGEPLPAIGPPCVLLALPGLLLAVVGAAARRRRG